MMKTFKYFLDSWLFAQFDSFIECKAQLLGVKIAHASHAGLSWRCLNEI